MQGEQVQGTHEDERQIFGSGLINISEILLIQEPLLAEIHWDLMRNCMARLKMEVCLIYPFFDLSRLKGMEIDRNDFDQILPLLENGKKIEARIILAGPELGESGNQIAWLNILLETV